MNQLEGPRVEIRECRLSCKMCSRGNPQLLFQFSIFLKFLLFATLMSIGGIFVGNTDLERAYGNVIVRHGAGLLIVGSCVPLSQYIGSRGSEQHNTFLLLVHTMAESTLFAIQFSISNDVMDISQDEFSPAFRENCLRTVPGASTPECSSYIQSDRYAGMHLTWAANYDLAQDDSDFYKKLEDLQNAGDCCGFAAPTSCEEDRRPPPEDRLVDELSKDFRLRRQTCGAEDGW